MTSGLHLQRVKPLATLVGGRLHRTHAENSRDGSVAVAEGRTLVETVLAGKRGDDGLAIRQSGSGDVSRGEYR